MSTTEVTTRAPARIGSFLEWFSEWERTPGRPSRAEELARLIESHTLDQEPILRHADAVYLRNDLQRDRDRLARLQNDLELHHKAIASGNSCSDEYAHRMVVLSERQLHRVNHQIAVIANKTARVGEWLRAHDTATAEQETAQRARIDRFMQKHAKQSGGTQ